MCYKFISTEKKLFLYICYQRIRGYIPLYFKINSIFELNASNQSAFLYVKYPKSQSSQIENLSLCNDL